MRRNSKKRKNADESCGREFESAADDGIAPDSEFASTLRSECRFVEVEKLLGSIILDDGRFAEFESHEDEREIGSFMTQDELAKYQNAREKLYERSDAQYTRSLRMILRDGVQNALRDSETSDESVARAVEKVAQSVREN